MKSLFTKFLPLLVIFYVSMQKERFLDFQKMPRAILAQSILPWNLITKNRKTNIELLWSAKLTLN